MPFPKGRVNDSAMYHTALADAGGPWAPAWRKYARPSLPSMLIC